MLKYNITSQLTRYSRKRLIAASEQSKNLQKADKSTFRHSDINKNKEAHTNERKPSSRQTQIFQLQQNSKDSNTRLTSQKLVALRTQTSYVSFRLHSFPRTTTCPRLRGSSMLPSPPPSLEGRGRLSRRIPVAR